MYIFDITGRYKYRLPNFDNKKRTSRWAKENTRIEMIFLKLATISSHVLKKACF